MKVFSGSIGGSHSLIGVDNANNSAYDDNFISGDNGGYGFQGWNFSDRVGTNGVFIGSSTAQGFGDINVNGESFAAFGNPGGGNGLNMNRALSRPLSVGFALSAECAIAFRSGAKGFSLFNGTGFATEIYNFNAGPWLGNDEYTYNIGGGNQILPWLYSQTSIFRFVARQTTTTNVQVTLTRGSDTDTRNVTGNLGAFKFYIFNTNAGNDLNNLFFNSMRVYRY
jgi:hypothetical protein